LNTSNIKAMHEALEFPEGTLCDKAHNLALNEHRPKCAATN